MDVNKNLIVFLVNQFGLKISDVHGVENFDFGLRELELQLSFRIKHLIDYDRDKLMHSLYRIDVNEEEVKKIFKSSSSELIPIKIARLIIKRTAEKMKNYNNTD